MSNNTDTVGHNSYFTLAGACRERASWRGQRASAARRRAAPRRARRLHICLSSACLRRRCPTRLRCALFNLRLILTCEVQSQYSSEYVGHLS